MKIIINFLFIGLFFLMLGCEKDSPLDAIIEPDPVNPEKPIDKYETDPINWEPEPRKDQVVLLIKRTTYENLKSEILQYKKDVETNFPVQLNIVTGTWFKPLQIRETINKVANEKGLSGVVLVGDIPMHKFFMHGFLNPNPLYFEDYNLKFDNDETAAKYLEEPAPKIWVANLRSVSSPDLKGIEELKSFFVKTHSYYSGQISIRHRALFAAGWEWPGGAHESSKAMSSVFSNNEIDVITNDAGKDSGKESIGATYTNLTTAFKDNYLMYYIQVHSYEKGHDLENGGKLLATDIAKWKTGALFVINHGCSAGNWLKAAPDLNISQAYVFGSSIGQAIVCQVRTGMVYGHEKIYENLSAGDYVGKAYLEAKKVAEKQMYHEYPNGEIFSGVVLIGNPFIYVGKK